MARHKSDKREQAKRLWLESGRQAKLKDIAARLDVSEEQIRKWKCLDKWEAEPAKKNKGNVTNAKSNVTELDAKRKEKGQNVGHRAPPGNQYAVGHGAPEGNANAVKHGLYQAVANMYFTEADRDLFNAAGKVAGIESEIGIARFKLARLLREQEKRNARKLQGTMGSAFGPVAFNLKDDFYENAINQILTIIGRLEKQLLKAQIEQDRLDLEKRRLAILESKAGDGEELPDDGFLAALEGKAADIWKDEPEGGDTP